MKLILLRLASLWRNLRRRPSLTTEPDTDVRSHMSVRAFLDVARADFRYALRSLARTPAFTVAAVLTLAFGAGATAAVVIGIDHFSCRHRLEISR